MQTSLFRGLVTLASFSIALLVALTVHEFSHALSATLLGDNTARRQGRLSLNPLAHLDPLGTAMILLAGFGWAKPTPVDPAFLRIGTRPGMAVVSLAGPFSNLVVAMLAATPINAGILDPSFAWFTIFTGQPGGIVSYVIGSVIFLNLLLAAFNLIPVAPLDGFKVAAGLLPREASYRFSRLEPYGPAILLLLIMSSFLLPGPSILFSIMRPILNGLSILVFGGHPAP